ncbi:MAG: hypothetical protein KDB88_13710 [Flavobacteriales bacterium]|nr:hypothetical protein [Flavobacteriales bacterium]
MLNRNHLIQLIKAFSLVIVAWLQGNATAFAQLGETHYMDNWHLGEGVQLQFDGIQIPTVINGPDSNTIGNLQSISDPFTGDLLFTISYYGFYDKNGDLMPNGGNVFEAPVVIIPHPGDLDLYYAIHTGSAGQLVYSIVDLSLNGGKGDVLPASKLVPFGPLQTALYEEVISDPSGLRHWLLTHNTGSDEFLLFEIEANDGLDTIPEVIAIGPVATTPFSVRRMDVTVSSDRLAMAMDNSQDIWLFDVDPFTGIITDPVVLDLDHFINALSFSASGNILYVGNRNDMAPIIFQYDLTAGDPVDILATQYAFPPSMNMPTGVSNLQLGPDGRLWVEPYAINDWALQHLTRIENPEVLGPNAGLDTNGLDLGQEFLTSPRIPLVYWPYAPTVGIGEVPGSAPALSLEVYPSPVQRSCTFSASRSVPGASLRLVDGMGRTIRDLPFAAWERQITVDVSDLPGGLYHATIVSAEGLSLAAVKWVKQ